MMQDRNIRLVVAEDDFLVGEEIKRILRGSRYEVVGEAVNGQQALALVAELRPDLLVMDIRMPVMDGLEAARRITAQYPTPIVIMTAYESPDLVERAGEAGVAAFLTKPPEFPKFDRASIIALARHGDMMELRRLNGELQNALAEIRTLRGVLPLCSFCKKIHLPDDTWENIDVYIHRHTEAEISHGLCPDCLKKHYPEYAHAIPGGHGSDQGK